MKYWYVYQIIFFKETEQKYYYYVGQHSYYKRQTDETLLNDGYLGSGVLSKKFRDHGFKFIKKILVKGIKTQEEANSIEKRAIVLNSEKHREYCLNILDRKEGTISYRQLEDLFETSKSSAPFGSKKLTYFNNHQNEKTSLVRLGDLEK